MSQLEPCQVAPLMSNVKSTTWQHVARVRHYIARRATMSCCSLDVAAAAAATCIVALCSGFNFPCICSAFHLAMARRRSTSRYFSLARLLSASLSLCSRLNSLAMSDRSCPNRLFSSIRCFSKSVITGRKVCASLATALHSSASFLVRSSCSRTCSRMFTLGSVAIFSCFTSGTSPYTCVNVAFLVRRERISCSSVEYSVCRRVISSSRLASTPLISWLPTPPLYPMCSRTLFLMNFARVPNRRVDTVSLML
mmetsp:Transcript_25257/g.54948  ORF Transcript_25257/g.54948 Transcript_25257/m.54948 type:complete len:252 (-) Transcript_25257:930-1685(-)